MNSHKNLRLNTLFNKWKKQYPDSENFVKDGIIDEELFDQSPQKILFITKEPNDPKQKGKDYRIWWNEEIYFKFSYRIAEWTYGIHNDFPPYDRIWPDNEDEIAHKSLKSIAFMNVKKSGEGGASEEKEINKYVNRDIEYIHKQIDIIDPKVIIIGMSWASTVNLLFPEVDWKQSGYGIEIGRYNGSKVIDFYHPSSRNGPSASYSLLQNVVGVFHSMEVIKYVKKHFKDETNDENERNNLICSASIKVEESGKFLIGSFGISTLPWALGQLANDKIKSDRWKNDFTEIEEKLNADLEYLLYNVFVLC